MEHQGVRKTNKYRLTPTPDQERMLDHTLMLCRHVYNGALEQRKTWWERGQGKSATYYQQKAELPDLKATCPEYTVVHAHVLQDVILRVERAYQAFFRRVAAGATPGYPRFQGANRYHSFTFPEYGNGVVLDGGLLSLSKIGRIHVRVHRPIEGTPKTATIVREADGWYVAISCAEVPTEALPLTGQETGLDVGIAAFATLADGTMVHNPHHYRRAERYLAKCQRRVTKRVKGGRRRGKAVVLLAKAHQTVKRQRADFHHKTALALVRAYDTIYVEAIQPANLSRRPAPRPDGAGGYAPNGARRKAGLNTSIHDAGWSQFLSTLAFKAACAGKRMETVSPAYTSQDCSSCGAHVHKSLSVRTHVCTSCGLILDRDANAARNIQWRGQRLRGLAGMPAGMNREAALL